MAKNQPDDTPLDEVSREILRYIVAHPGAKDTASGIAKWWLAKSVSREGTKRIEESLQFLVTRGWLIGRSPQSETIYSLNENTLPEIERFLNQSH